MGKFGLPLAADKTRIVPFRRGEAKGQFDFLGFTLRWGRSRKGKPLLQRTTTRKKLHGAIERFTQWIRVVRHQRVRQTLRETSAKLRGHYAYYGLRGNGHKLTSYYRAVAKALFKWLNRRSEKRSYTWSQFERLLRRQDVPLPRIRGPSMRQLAFETLLG